VGQGYRQRQQFGRFVNGETEHHTLVTGPVGVDANRDLGRLLMQVITKFRLLAKPPGRYVVSEPFDGITGYELKVKHGRGFDFTKQGNLVGTGDSFDTGP